MEDKLSDNELLQLFDKYPFLIYHNVFDDKKTYDLIEEDLKHNWWTVWDNYGWEHIWKNFMRKVFEEYDKMSDSQKQNFSIFDTKEKYGSLRVYLSGYTDNLLEQEMILSMMSQWTCYCCGKMPRDSRGNRLIWTSKGWICPYCKDHLKVDYSPITKKNKQEFREYVKLCRETHKGFFVTKSYSKDKNIKKYYRDIGDWLELDHIE